MVSYRVLQVLLLVSSMTFQMIGMLSQEMGTLPSQKKKISEELGMLFPELKRKIFSYALELLLSPKYVVHKKFDVGSKVQAIVLNQDNTKALTVSVDGIARVWDVGKEEVITELKVRNVFIRSVALSADGNSALTASDDKIVRIWDTITGKLVKNFQVGLVFSVALSADGSRALIAVSEDGIVRLYNTSTGELIQELKGHTGVIRSVALSADGTLALTGSADDTAIVWNTHTGKPFRVFPVCSWIASVALSTDGTSAVIETYEFQAKVSDVKIWDTQTGAALSTLIKDCLVFNSIALSKDGKWFITTTHGNKTIQVWNTHPLPGKQKVKTPLLVLEGHTDGVLAAAFGNGDLIASGSKDTTALIWKPLEYITLK